MNADWECPKDAVVSYSWYLLSAKKGDKEALENIDRLKKTLTKLQIEQAQAKASDFKETPDEQ